MRSIFPVVVKCVGSGVDRGRKQSDFHSIRKDIAVLFAGFDEGFSSQIISKPSDRPHINKRKMILIFATILLLLLLLPDNSVGKETFSPRERDQVLRDFSGVNLMVLTMATVMKR